MDFEEILGILLQALSYYGFYKFGQYTLAARLSKAQQEEINEPMSQPKLPRRITVEEINGIYYAYDGDDFLAQGRSPEELGQMIAQRFPNKYNMATVKVKLST